MNWRQIGILAAVAAVMVAVTVILYAGRGPSSGEFAGDTLLIQGLDPQAVKKIVIRADRWSSGQAEDKAGHTVTLEQKDGGGGFVIAEKDGYPASMKQINDFVIKCLEIRCAQKITDNKENHAALGLVENEKDAVTVSFFGAGGKLLIGFVQGKALENGNGSYVRLLGSDTAYRTAEYLWIEPRATDYIDKELVRVQKDDIARVEVKVDKDSYAIARDDKGNIALENLPKDKRAKGTEYEDVFSALTSLDLTDVSPADKTTLTWDATYVCRLKSGLSYTIQLAKKDNSYYAKLSAAGPEVGRVQISQTESQEELKKKEALLLARDTAAKFNPLHARWVYEISSWKAEKMRKTLADLTEEVPKETTPEEISASHILIAYKGAEQAKATRTKDEAKALAEKVLAEAKAPGADFAALAKKYSDGPTRDKGGDLGSFKKGKMAAAFEEAAFKLKVGELSAVVETPFGFHVIERTK